MKPKPLSLTVGWCIVCWFAVGHYCGMKTSAHGDDDSPDAIRMSLVAEELQKLEAAENRIRAALLENTDIAFVETPLSDVLEYLQDKHGINIKFEASALDAVGIGADSPVTCNFRGITVRSELRLILRDRLLTYVIQDEILQVVPQEEAEKRSTTRVYDVSDLIREDLSTEDLGELIRASWGTTTKSPGRIEVLGTQLVLIASWEQHETAGQLLVMLRGDHTKKGDPARRPSSQIPKSSLPETKVAEGRTAQPKRTKKPGRVVLLDLTRTSIDDDTLGRIVQVQNLESVRLADTRITDVGIGHLRLLKNLYELDLRNTEITDKGLEKLSEIHSLRTLLLGEAKGVSNSALYRLRSNLPRCRIITSRLSRAKQAPQPHDPFDNSQADQPESKGPSRTDSSFRYNALDPFSVPRPRKKSSINTPQDP